MSQGGEKEMKHTLAFHAEGKNPCGFVTETFQTGITNPQRILELRNFWLMNVTEIEKVSSRLFY